MTRPPGDPAATPIDRLFDPGPPPPIVTPVEPATSDLIRRRQRGAARMTGIALAVLAVLIFLITVAKQAG